MDKKRFDSSSTFADHMRETEMFWSNKNLKNMFFFTNREKGKTPFLTVHILKNIAYSNFIDMYFYLCTTYEREREFSETHLLNYRGGYILSREHIRIS